jgi:hypothetical protein
MENTSRKTTKVRRESIQYMDQMARQKERMKRISRKNVLQLVELAQLERFTELKRMLG